MASPDRTVCFVIGPIGSSGSAIRKRADRILRDVIQPAVTDAGYRCVRGDEMHGPGSISAQILSRLSEDPLAVADLTGLNPNVMYELALRHSSGGPVALVAAEGTKLPFDIHDHDAVFVNVENDDSVALARHELADRLRRAVSGARRSVWGSAGVRGRLNDAQTRDVILLHQASVAYRIMMVVEEAIEAFEEAPETFDATTFHRDLEAALLESRRLCATLESEKLGELRSFFDRTMPHSEFHAFVDMGLTIILDATTDASTKRRRYAALLKNTQIAVNQKVDDALQGG